MVRELIKTDPPDGEIVTTALAWEPLYEAVIVADVDVLRLPAVREVLAVVLHAAMVTLD